MARIVPEIHKSKQMPKSLCWPVQYSHVEACLAGRCAEELLLSMSFWHWSAWVTTSFTVHPDSVPKILILDYDPHFSGFWHDGRDYRYVVRAKVYPIPVTTWKASSVTKARLREVLLVQTRELLPKRLPSDRWNFELSLNPKQQAIVGMALNWNGIREGEPVKINVPAKPQG